MRRMRRSAMTRFNAQHRPVRDDTGATIGYRFDEKRPAESGPTSGFLVRHEERNRAKRRALGREYGYKLPALNHPARKEEMTAADILLIHTGERG